MKLRKIKGFRKKKKTQDLTAMRQTSIYDQVQTFTYFPGNFDWKIQYIGTFSDTIKKLYVGIAICLLF